MGVNGPAKDSEATVRQRWRLGGFHIGRSRKVPLSSEQLACEQRPGRWDGASTWRCGKGKGREVGMSWTCSRNQRWAPWPPQNEAGKSCGKRGWRRSRDRSRGHLASHGKEFGFFFWVQREAIRGFPAEQWRELMNWREDKGQTLLFLWVEWDRREVSLLLVHLPHATSKCGDIRSEICFTILLAARFFSRSVWASAEGQDVVLSWVTTIPSSGSQKPFLYCTARHWKGRQISTLPTRWRHRGTRDEPRTSLLVPFRPPASP